MFSPQNSSNHIGTFFRVLITVVVFVIIVQGFLRSNGPPTPRMPSGSPSGPARNPIADLLKLPVGQERRPGVVVAILVDTSGSMEDPVRDSEGKPKPKIQIARECVLKLLDQTDRFAKSHPDRPVVLGIYEFSARNRQPSARRVVPLGPVNAEAARSAVGRMVPSGGTPIGDAMIAAKRDLDGTGMAKLHLLVVTDGENNQGYDPGDVADALSRQAEEWRTAVYFVAFDVGAEKFKSVREAGGLVLPAGNERELQQTLDYVLTGKILAEQPEVPKTR